MTHSDTYLVGREKIREYAAAIGETAEICHDVAAARAAGFEDVVAPPMFAAVYSWRAMGPAVLDPEIGIDFGRMVHGAQEFTWHEPVIAGDEITTEASFLEEAKRGEIKVYTFSSRSINQRGELVCEGKWTNFVR
jgi:acyl dehydratase